MEHELQKLANILKHETLSQDEAARLRARLSTYIINHPTKESLPVYHRIFEHTMRIALSTFLFIIFVGGSISVIADNSLPGDKLYAIKTGINEKWRGAFLTSPAKKAAYQTGLIQERLSEVQTLAETKTLTPARQKTAEKALDSHLTELSAQLNKTDPNAALAVTDTLKAAISAKKDAVTASDVSLSSDEKAQVLDTYNSALAGISQQEVQIISKQVDEITKDVLTTNTPDATATIDPSIATTPSTTTSTSTDATTPTPVAP